MDEIYERIKYIRKSKLGLTQDEFSSKINISRANLASIEVGRISVTDRVIADICREFLVNETWLRFGEGDPFDEPSEEVKLAKFFGHIMASDDSHALKALMQAFANLGPEYWEQAEKLLKELLEEIKKGH